MRRFCMLCMVLFAIVPVLAEEAKEHFTEAEFRSAVRVLRAAPTGPKARAACQLIVVWVTESPNVEVTLGKAIVGIIDNGKNQEEMSLVAAFSAGQALAQLDNKKDSGFAEAGGREAIALYNQIRKSNPDYTNPAMESLVEAEKQGRLKEVLETKD
ncbi:MAG: hypothetical protein KC910_08215 [Candidatus Eremiobacteraeota bacterium]|nr:hypothetical protein [Candidatus Eremiobacteraeota bacterium]